MATGVTISLWGMNVRDYFLYLNYGKNRRIARCQIAEIDAILASSNGRRPNRPRQPTSPRHACNSDLREYQGRERLLLLPSAVDDFLGWDRQYYGRWADETTPIGPSAIRRLTGTRATSDSWREIPSRVVGLDVGVWHRIAFRGLGVALGRTPASCQVPLSYGPAYRAGCS
jgi:hypothetical protein